MTSPVTQPMLSAVVTCYMDAQAVVPLYERLSHVLAGLGVKYEIIFVNDGSPDHADSVLREVVAKDHHVMAIEHSRNFGSQNAFISGMQLATGDAVILLDGDLQDPPELIAAFYAKWQDGYHVVYGRRVTRQGSPLLTLSAKAFYRVFRGVSEVAMPLDAGDFALMDQRVVRELLALPETDQFLRGLRGWVGFRQTGVDYVRPKRAFGRSTHSFLKNFWWARKAIYSFTFLPIELLGYLAATLTLLSLGAAVLVGSDALAHPEKPLGTPAILVSVALFGSLNLLGMTILGEYLIKIFEETKRRPKFIRKTIRHAGQHLATAEAIDDFVRQRSQAAVSRQAARTAVGVGRSGEVGDAT